MVIGLYLRVVTRGTGCYGYLFAGFFFSCFYHFIGVISFGGFGLSLIGAFYGFKVGQGLYGRLYIVFLYGFLGTTITRSTIFLSTVKARRPTRVFGGAWGQRVRRLYRFGDLLGCR